MKGFNLAIACIGLFLSVSVFADVSEIPSHYKVNFDNGSVYDVAITPKQLTWKGISGEEKGKEQTIKNYKHTNITNVIEVLQWVGLKGSFNTVVIDHDQLKIVASGKDKKESWFWNGTLEKLPTA